MTPPTPCATCVKNITKTQGSIDCQLCFKYFHASCVGVSLELLNNIAKSKGSLKFTCDACLETSPVPFGSDAVSIRDELRSGLADIKNKFDTILAEIRQEMGTNIKELRKDIENCHKMVNYVDASTTKKIKILEDQNEILHKRLNRADIIINGFDKNQENINDIVLEIFKELKVDITNSDISICCFINGGYSVLVKLNSCFKRDLIMSNYHKTKSLKVSTFVPAEPGKENDIHKRVFLNDHLSAKAGRLCYLCRNLRRNKKINKFRLLNTDVPRVKVTFNDESSSVFDLAELNSFFNSTPNEATVDAQRNRSRDAESIS